MNCDPAQLAHLDPLHAVDVWRQGRRLVARLTEAMYAFSSDPSGAWSSPEQSVDELDRACVNGGIAEAIELSKRRHNRAVVQP